MVDPFAREFLDDFFAESEEHLATLRGAVLTLEESAGGSWNAGEVKSVQRSLHTLKGLAGMVGFEEVERAAHAVEELVRWSLEAGLGARAEVLTVLYSGIQLIDRALASRRGGGEGESAAPLVEAVAALTHPTAPAASAGPSVSAVPSAPPLPPAAAPSAATLLEVRFSPTTELLARGIGVETIRARLGAVGTIRSVAPRVAPGGEGVAFHFLVEAPEGWEPDDAWRDEGLSWSTPDEPGAPALGTARSALQATSTASNVVRVDLARLDDLMRLVGELVVSRARLEDGLRQLEGTDAAARLPVLQETSEAIERQLRALREGVMRVRLVPVGEVFERLRFAIRDVARESGKDVVVDVVGADTEIDRLIVDRMMEPLLHLVRNAVSHGLETPAERAQAGKPRQGRITLRAAASGDRIRIEVEDDGAGVDARAVADRAEQQGIPVGSGPLDAARVLDLLCASGFSTREQADRTSGRGVGMEVVRSTVRALNGELSMRSQPRRGTLFAVDLPLTLMIVDALLVRVGDQTIAVPQPVLREVLKLEPSAVTPMGDGEILSYRGGVLPLIRLARVFGLGGSGGDARASKGLHVLVVGDDGDRIGLVVEGLAGLREIVVHPVDDPLVATVGVSGATELSDGRLGLILDAAALTRDARARASRRAPAGLLE